MSKDTYVLHELENSQVCMAVQTFFSPQTCLKARILDGMHGQYIPGFYGMHECPNLGDFDFTLNIHRKIEAHQAFSELFV